MTRFEKLLDKAKEYNLKVYENFDIGVKGVKGLISGNKIALATNLTEIEKTCVIAEEIAHAVSSVGNILDQKKTSNRKQELKAHRIAANYLITIEDLVEAVIYLKDEANYYTISEHLGITEEFLHEAIMFFQYKYGSYTIIGNYYINFSPLNIRKVGK